MCIAWESVSAEALTGVAALGSLTLPDAEEFLSLSGAVVAVGDYPELSDAAESLENFVVECSQELSGDVVDAADSLKPCAFAAAASCQVPAAGDFPRLFDAVANFQELSVDVVDPQVPSVAVAADSPIYSALAAAVAGWLEYSHFRPALNCSYFPGRVAEGSPQMVLGCKAQNLTAAEPAVLLLLSPAVLPHLGAKGSEPVVVGMGETETPCQPIPFHYHLHLYLLETTSQEFPARTVEVPEEEQAEELLCLLTRTLGTMRARECPASEWWTTFLEW